VELESNTGSANGYAVGIQTALAWGAEYLWLMDDDNAPAKGTLALLRQELSRLSAEVGVDRAAVSGFRASRMKTPGNLRRNFAPPSNFVGFHASQIPQKLSRFLRPQTAGCAVAGQAIDVPYAPYGGFLAHCQVFRHIGVPKTDLVLYADDWEYTMRLTKNGGRIRLVVSAVIDELEVSWNRERKQANVFLQSLVSGTDVQVYYTFRNHVWLNRNVQCASQFIYRVNKYMFLALLSVFAISLRRGQRLDLIRRAVSDGEQACLGINPNYPLA
jgi:GT2 family glycosyltransferase